MFTDDSNVLARTRSVTCVTPLGTELLGTECYFENTGPYGFGISAEPKTMQLARNRFAITVYELHSGGILHKGEIETRADGCTEGAVVNGASMLAWGLTDQDVLAWLNAHFVDGKPA